MDIEWVNINQSYDKKDVPRRLTEKEILYISSHVPKAPSADITAANVCQENVKEWVAEMLVGEKMCPSSIPELIDIIIDQHYNSLVAPGTPLIVAPEAVGSTTTQMTLNTFHSSGSSKSASIGIDAMKDIIFARLAVKNEFCTIRFKENKSYEQVLESRKNICGTYVSDFVKDYDILDSKTAPKFWWHDTIQELLDEDLTPEETNSEKMLRLYLNVNEMYKYKVTIQDIVSKIEATSADTPLGGEGSTRKKKSKSGVKLFVSAFSPTSIGIIDFYPREDMISDFVQTLEGEEKYKGRTDQIPRKIMEEIYLENFVIPDLKNIKVNGITGITNLVPVVEKVWSAIINEKNVEKEEAIWILKYSDSVMNRSGITIEAITKLLKEAGITVEDHLKALNRFQVKLPRDRFRTAENESVVVDKTGKKFYIYFSPKDVVGKGDDYYVQVDVSKWKKVKGGWDETSGKKTRFHPTNTIVETKEGTFRKIKKENTLIENNIFYENVTNLLDYRELKPSEYIFYKVRDHKNRVTEKNMQLRNTYKLEAKKLPEEKREGWILRQPLEPQDPLVLASELVYAEAKGSNLRELFTIPEIDSNRTTCNNMHVISNVFGIEAARTFVIKSLYDNITNYGSYVSPANILFIAEFITSRGVPLGATYTGISRQKGGHLSLATIERAGLVFTKSAIYGQKENIKNVSASIVVGSRVAIGDGSFDIAQDIIKNGEEKTVINNDLFELFHDSAEPEIDVDDETFYEELVEGGYFKGDSDIPNFYEKNDAGNIVLFDEEDLTCIKEDPIAELTNGPPKEGTEEALQYIVYGIPTSTVTEEEKEIENEKEEPDSSAILFPVCKETKEPIKIPKKQFNLDILSNLDDYYEKFTESKEPIISPSKEKEEELFDLPSLNDFDLNSPSVTKEREKEKNKGIELINIDALSKALQNK